MTIKSLEKLTLASLAMLQHETVEVVFLNAVMKWVEVVQLHNAATSRSPLRSRASG